MKISPELVLLTALQWWWQCVVGCLGKNGWWTESSNSNDGDTNTTYEEQGYIPPRAFAPPQREAVYKGVSNRELGRHDLNGRYSPLEKHAHDEDFSSHELSTCHDRYGSASEEVVICHDYDMNG
ncbi:hypothetical protein L484_026451 [Morus notabilis]|uniref:Uncharacterized protein n=1 Tax=Morus notabilis TaxID=981085 RepID=W9QYX0_9ROSA|nr:hypothetical protein L484_026451 [Morus notabilis]